MATPSKLLDPLQQVVDLDVGEAVVRVLHLHAAAEQRVGLVEEQQRAGALAGVEHLAQPLLGLADVLVDHAGEVDAIEIEPERARQHLRRHGLAGAARPAEQRRDAVAEMGEPLEAPFLIDRPAQPHLRLEVVERFAQRR